MKLMSRQSRPPSPARTFSVFGEGPYVAAGIHRRPRWAHAGNRPRRGPPNLYSTTSAPASTPRSTRVVLDLLRRSSGLRRHRRRWRASSELFTQLLQRPNRCSFPEQRRSTSNSTSKREPAHGTTNGQTHLHGSRAGRHQHAWWTGYGRFTCDFLRARSSKLKVGLSGYSTTCVRVSRTDPDQNQSRRCVDRRQRA